MKICMLTDAWTPIWGGGQTHILEVSKKLRSDYGCQVDIVVPNLGPAEGVVQIGQRFIFPDLFGRLTFMFTVAGYCLRNDYDIYISHAYSTSVFLFLVKLFRNKKIFFVLHGAGVKGRGAGIFNYFGFPALLSYLFLYWYPYDGLMTAAVSSVLPEYRNKVTYVGNGVDTEKFKGAKLKKDHTKVKLLWVGRNDPVKGLKYLNEAFYIAIKEVKNLCLEIVQNKSHEEVTKEYAKADIFVLSSLSEGLPVVLLEAMAAKLPIIATDVGDCRKLVEEAGAGKVVRPADTQVLAEAIIKLAKDKDRNKYGLAGFNYVKANYSWDRVAEREARAIGVAIKSKGTK